MYTSTSAFSLATAFYQLITNLSNGWKVVQRTCLASPSYFQPHLAGFRFAFCTLAWLICRYLGGSPDHMLNEGRACRWKGIIRSLLYGKLVQSCLINLACSALLAIHYIVITNLSRMLRSASMIREY